MTQQCCDNLVGCVGPISFKEINLISGALDTVQKELELGLPSTFATLIKCMAVVGGADPAPFLKAAATQLGTYCQQLTELIKRMGEQDRVFIIAKGLVTEAPGPVPVKKKKKKKKKEHATT